MIFTTDLYHIINLMVPSSRKATEGHGESFDCAHVKLERRGKENTP